MNEELTQVTLQTALIQHTPGIHHSDQRVQYAATAYVQLLEETGVQISMAEVGQAWHKELCWASEVDHQRRGGDLSEYDE